MTVINAGEGSDAFVYNVGGGALIINEIQKAAGGDVLELGEGIELENLSLLRNVNDLVVRVGAGGDQITFKNIFSDAVGALATITLSDETSYTLSGLIAERGLSEVSIADEIKFGKRAGSQAPSGTEVVYDQYYFCLLPAWLSSSELSASYLRVA